jgi:hypothetical protein
MVKPPVRWLRLLPLVFAVLIPSCASGPPPGPTPAELAGTAATTIIIAPFNVVSSLPPELEGSTKMVSAVLVEHLEAHGKTVAVMGFRAGRDLWKASMKAVRDSGEKRNFENAARVYARKIGKQFEFDAMIVPSLFIQNAKAGSRTAKWDGAEQKVEQRGSLKGNVLFQGQSGTFNIRAASIFIYLLDRDGNVIHTKRMGLELIQHVEFKTEAEAGHSSKRNHTWTLASDVPPIQDKDRVRAGISTVLFPFLPEVIPTSAATSPEPQ